MCPPEYAELEGGKPNGATFRNLNHTAPGPCYASTSVLDTQYPLPPLPQPTSSEEGGHTGETSCGSGDSSSGGASAESRARRSRGRTESRASGSNSSDSSGRGTTDTTRLGGLQVETRLTASAAPSPYHRPPPGPPTTDPGLPPVPPLRGLSSYQVKFSSSLTMLVCD